MCRKTYVDTDREGGKRRPALGGVAMTQMASRRNNKEKERRKAETRRRWDQRGKLVPSDINAGRKGNQNRNNA